MKETTKAMSDTPRTDNERGYYDVEGFWTYSVHGGIVSAEFARQLERELTTANERIARLYAALEECDEAFTKFSPDPESRYGKAWASTRHALRKVQPSEPEN